MGVKRALPEKLLRGEHRRLQERDAATLGSLRRYVRLVKDAERSRDALVFALFGLTRTRLTDLAHPCWCKAESFELYQEAGKVRRRPGHDAACVLARAAYEDALRVQKRSGT